MTSATVARCARRGPSAGQGQAGAPATEAGSHSLRDAAGRNHADQVTILIHHRQTADAMLERHACRLFHWGICTYALPPQRHEVGCLHFCLLGREQ